MKFVPIIVVIWRKDKGYLPENERNLYLAAEMPILSSRIRHNVTVTELNLSLLVER